MKIDKDIKYGIIGIIIGILLMGLILFMINKISYERECDTMPFSDAWKREGCRQYFKRTMTSMEQENNRLKNENERLSDDNYRLTMMNDEIWELFRSSYIIKKGENINE